MPRKKATDLNRPDFPDVSSSRAIQKTTQFCLVAAAGGRCEFDGCNNNLFVHHVTKTGGYFGNFAHIRAFSPQGPRAGTDSERDEVALNDIDNLMLLCTQCHKLVDTDVEGYSIERLRRWKQKHEERVTHLLGLPDANEAAVMEIWTNVSVPPVVRSTGKIIAALLPLYPSRVHRYMIDFTSNNLSDATLIQAATMNVDQEVQRLFSSTGEKPGHLAVFGITNIPLLVYLGSKLGDRIQVHVFQHHRDTSDWKWKQEPSKASFGASKLREGSDPKRVALLLSLSGSIDPTKLPAEIDASYTIYEIRLSSEVPTPGFLRTEEDLTKFRDVYRKFLSGLQVSHGTLDELAVIPAIPVPIAICLGMDRLPKIAPNIVIYDIDKNNPDSKSYRKMLEVR